MYDIKCYKDIFNQEDWNNIYKKLDTAGWRFGQYSNEDKEGEIGFWIYDLREDEFFTDYLFKKLCSVLDKDFKLAHVYANGQTVGQDGSFHQDDSVYTCLLYANPYWEIEWGGKTIFKMEGGEPASVSPRPRSAVLFDSKLFHYGEAPYSRCRDLRVTVAYKLDL